MNFQRYMAEGQKYLQLLFTVEGPLVFMKLKCFHSIGLTLLLLFKSILQMTDFSEFSNIAIITKIK